MTNHPQVDLFESTTPALFVLFHPTPITREIRHVDHKLHKVITDDLPHRVPVSFDLLRLVAGGAKVIHDFQDGLSEQFAGHIPSVIELKWEQDLESPPFAAHK